MGKESVADKRRREFAQECAIALGLNEAEKKLSFREFVNKVYPKYKWYRHCEALADVLQKVADGELNRTMIFCPPRHGKSQLATRLFPAYYLYRYPERFVGINSYSADLAKTFSRAARDAFWEGGGQTREDSAAVDLWNTTENGGCWAAGVGGSITGKGFHCFPAQTLVFTELGWIDIATLYQLKYRINVLSFNHEKQRHEWKPVVATMRQTVRQGLIEITTQSGRTIRATRDHPFYIQGFGYKQAADIKSGDNFITFEITEQQNLSNLWTTQRWQGNNLQGLLSSCSTFNGGRTQVRLLRDHVHPFKVPTRESLKTWLQRCLLLCGLFTESPRSQKSPQVHNVWQRGSAYKHWAQILFAGVLGQKETGLNSKWAQTSRQDLSSLREVLPAQKFKDSVLLKELRESSALRTDEGYGQLSIQGWHKLCKMLSGNASANLRPRWERLRGLQLPRSNHCDQRWAEAHESHNSSYRRGCDQQQAGKPSDSLRNLSHKAPPLSTDTVTLVRELRSEQVDVYDIEVEGNHNFFAEGILVHNCGIIDDPLKNAQEAFSDTVRKGHKEWYDSTFATREEPGGAIVIILTRWHEDDLAGWLLSREKSTEDEPEYWHIVNFPAIAEDELPKFPDTCTVEADWRLPGEALCPERYPLSKLRKFQKNRYFWFALYQQRPAPADGDIFKAAWFKFYTQLPEYFPLLVLSVDASFKETNTGSFVVIQLWGVVWPNFYLIDQIRDRMGYIATVGAIKALINRWKPSYGEPHAKLIEDKANGPAIIEQLNRDFFGLIPIEPQGGKIVRAHASSPFYESGNVWLPDKNLMAWVEDHIDEFIAFPRGNANDQVDAASQFLCWIAESGGIVEFESIGKSSRVGSKLRDY